MKEQTNTFRSNILTIANDPINTHIPIDMKRNSYEKRTFNGSYQ